MEHDLETIGRMAARVVADQKKMNEAIDREEEAELDLVAACINTARRALPMLCSRLPRQFGMTGGELLQTRGMYITSDATGEDDVRGWYLAEDGTFFCATYKKHFEGHFFLVYTKVDPKGFLERFEATVLVSALVAAMRAQIEGKKSKAIDRIERAAERLEAVLTLLRG